MTNDTKHYAIIRKTSAGRTWYQSKDVGSITRKRADVWSTPSMQAAYTLAVEVGGTVVTEW